MCASCSGLPRPCRSPEGDLEVIIQRCRSPIVGCYGVCLVAEAQCHGQRVGQECQVKAAQVRNADQCSITCFDPHIMAYSCAA